MQQQNDSKAIDKEDNQREADEEDDDDDEEFYENVVDESIDQQITEVMAKLRGFLRATLDASDEEATTTSRRELLNALETVDFLCLVHPNAENNIDKINQAGASALLSKLLLRYEGDDNMLQLISQSIASLCGRSASRPLTREWSILNDTVHLMLRELSFVEADLGWKTWSASQLMSRLICNDTVQVRDKVVLELGCGTGLPGITAAVCDARRVVLSDFHPKVIENALFNVEQNRRNKKEADTNIEVKSLDWNDFVYLLACGDSNLNTTTTTTASFEPHGFDVILGSDVVYDPPHAKGIAAAAHRLLKSDGSVHITTPYPTQQRDGIANLEPEMASSGFELVSKTKHRFVPIGEKKNTTHTHYVFKRKLPI